MKNYNTHCFSRGHPLLLLHREAALEAQVCGYHWKRQQWTQQQQDSDLQSGPEAVLAVRREREVRGGLPPLHALHEEIHGISAYVSPLVTFTSCVLTFQLNAENKSRTSCLLNFVLGHSS